MEAASAFVSPLSEGRPIPTQHSDFRGDFTPPSSAFVALA